MDWQSVRKIWEEKKWRNIKKSDWVVVGLVGVLLLVMGIPVEDKQQQEQVENVGEVNEKTQVYESAPKDLQREYVSYLEEKIEELLSQMEGVGKVEVMITASDMGETVVEKDTNIVSSVTTEDDGAGGKRTVSETSQEETTIYIEGDEEAYPYIQKEKLPTIEGVVVVAEGGGSSVVVSDISEAVKALLPIEAHRIKVVKMCSKEE